MAVKLCSFSIFLFIIVVISDAKIILRRGELQYVAELKKGVPPQSVYVLLDTGSELIWVKCNASSICPAHEVIYNSLLSETYRRVHSSDEQCLNYSRGKCSALSFTKLLSPLPTYCLWNESYTDGTGGLGHLAMETFSHDEELISKDLVFGCAGEQKKMDKEHTGILGLNGEPMSLISQLKVKKFSYCFVPPERRNTDMKKADLNAFAGVLFVGNEAYSFGKYSTKILSGSKMYYFVSLEGISIREMRFRLPSEACEYNGGGQRGLVIDSGASTMFLTEKAYILVLEVVQNLMWGVELVENHDSGLQLCYRTSFVEIVRRNPFITLHLTGVDVILPLIGTYLQVTEWEWCLAVALSGDVCILGNLGQGNHMVTYDLMENTISFDPMKCAALEYA